jgi:hypothetical protein
MNAKSKFTLQVFEKIGTPLFASVNEVASRNIMTGQAKELPSDIEIAKTVAQLLTSVTQSGSKLSEKIGLTTNDPDSDAIQIALAGILSPIVANLYQVTGQTPKEQDLDRVLASFDTVASFSDNFTSLQDGANQLESLPASSPKGATQDSLRYTMAMVPLVNSVAAFSFGEEPDKLLKKVSERVTKEVKEISATVPGDNTDEISILSGIVTIYSQCHFSEMARIMAMTDEQRQTSPVTIDGVWAMVDQRLDMLKALVGGVTNSQQKAVEAPATTAEISSPPVTPATVQAETPKSSGGGPMSFFSKDDTASGEEQ